MYENYYLHRYKQDGRLIFVPTKNGRKEGEKFKKTVYAAWQKRDGVPGFYRHLSKGGYIKALHEHSHHDYFAKTDICCFFQKITKNKISRALKRFFSYEKAEEIAKKSTIQQEGKFHVPFGFVQSPMLATICLDRSCLGTKLKELNAKEELLISVYMDDILISSNKEEIVSESLSQIENKGKECGLELNSDKTEAGRTKIDIFNISVSKGRIQLTDDKYEILRKKFLNNPNPHSRAGINNYISLINKCQSNRIACRHLPF